MKTAGRQRQFAPADFFVFRTPLLPFDEFLKWSVGLEAAGALDDPQRFEQAYSADCARLRERLHAIVTRPEVRDALFVASPNIIERFHLWTDDPTSERGRKVEHVLVRYFSRMTARPTPFGLFAGCSIGTIGNQTQLTIEGREHYGRHTRLDNDYLFALIGALTHDPSLRELFNYHPNDSLYRAAGRLRYVESRLENKLRTYHLVAAEATSYLDDTLARAREGATVETLAAALVDEDISSDEAREYITELIESQILVPDLALQVTGSEPVHTLISQLREHEATAEAAHTLDRTRAEIELIDEAGLGIEPERYLSIARQLETLPAKVEPPRLFQVDMTKPAPEATLGGAVLDEIMRGIDVLRRLFARADTGLLKQFREAFAARYEEREVPLVEALDEEIGVGFGASEENSPLLKDLLFPPQSEESQLENAPRHELLLRKLSEALQSGAQEIALTPVELDAISDKNAPPLPDTFEIVARISAQSQATLERGEFQVFMEHIEGPSGARMLGRFCHADEALHKHVLSHLRAEESFHPEAIFAEIVHLPGGRIGNIIARPVLRDYEIPYLGRSGASAEHQIPATDLLLSVRAGLIRLRSARLNREVIPRLTNAHNYAMADLGVYKFLCALAQQRVAGGLWWDWGALAIAPFLPRVTTGRLVLVLARWRVNKDELRALGKLHGAARFQAVQKWREARRLPRLVTLADGDNVLPIDFDNALSVESFIQLVKERETAMLVEMFPAPDHLCAHGTEGAFVHELVVPFVSVPSARAGGSDRTVAESRPVTRQLPQAVLTRRFAPGSEWLYIKLYTGTATADALLRDIMRPLVNSLMQSGAANQWFFIRYGDPEWHLRLRFHGEPEKLQCEAMPIINAALSPLLDDGRIWRLQLDTYEREVERYGGAEGIVLAEQLFHADSEAALEIVEMLEPGDAGADERWRLTCYGIDLLLTDFGFDLKGKHAILKQTREAFAKEFRADKNLSGQLSEKFRKERQSLEALLTSAHEDEHPLAPGVAVLHRRSEHLSQIIAALKTCEEAGLLSAPSARLLPSYIHMHANRLLRSAQRQQELVIYDLMTRLYESRIARAADAKKIFP
jgi:thiopeptide-type bacteriocin biosynthesis protein